MDRADLQRRRDLLQERLRRRAYSEPFRTVAPKLYRARIKFAKRPPITLPRVLAAIYAAPGRDERIYWLDVRNGICTRWSTADDCALLVTKALDVCCDDAERIVIVVHPEKAGILLRKSEVILAWPLIHDELYETIWIVSAQPDRWVIEVSYVDNEVCYSTDVSHVAPKGI